jgi:hypothetical protein
MLVQIYGPCRSRMKYKQQQPVSRTVAMWDCRSPGPVRGMIRGAGAGSSPPAPESVPPLKVVAVYRLRDGASVLQADAYVTQKWS